MASNIEIVNMALTMLGAATISSLTQANARARAANTIFNATRDEVLRAGDWNFALITAPLAVLADDEDDDDAVDGWTYAYAMPTKCLRVVRIFSDSEGLDIKDPAKWRAMKTPTTKQQAIYTDVVDAQAEYVMRIEDASQFDASFVSAFAAKLAAKLAMPVTSDKQLAGMMQGAYDQAIIDAFQLGHDEGHQQGDAASSYVDSR